MILWKAGNWLANFDNKKLIVLQKSPTQVVTSTGWLHHTMHFVYKLWDDLTVYLIHDSFCCNNGTVFGRLLFTRLNVISFQVESDSPQIVLTFESMYIMHLLVLNCLLSLIQQLLIPPMFKDFEFYSK